MSGTFTWHGGRLAAARAQFGDGPHPWLDLSTGINPIAWPGAAMIAPDWGSLPDPEDLRALEQAAALHFGADPANVCAVPGSELGLRLLGALFDLPARHLTPSYRTHAEIFPDSRAVPAPKGPLPQATMLVLANPNNPDGRVLSPETLRRWLVWQEEAGGWLVVDEAFADGAPPISMAPHVANDRCLIVMRSFGKFFGLAGVRLGFLIGPRSVIVRLRRLLGDWPLSAAAIAIGRAAYGDGAWIAAAREALACRAGALDALLRNHGLAAAGDCPLFRLIEHDDAHGIFTLLARQQVLTRPFDDHPRWLRFGLPAGPEELERIDRALRHG